MTGLWRQARELFAWAVVWWMFRRAPKELVGDFECEALALERMCPALMAACDCRWGRHCQRNPAVPIADVDELRAQKVSCGRQVQFLRQMHLRTGDPWWRQLADEGRAVMMTKVGWRAE